MLTYSGRLSAWKHSGLIVRTNQDLESEPESKFNDSGGCGAVASAGVNGHPNKGTKKIKTVKKCCRSAANQM